MICGAGLVVALSTVLAVAGCADSSSGQPIHLVRTYRGTAVAQTTRSSSDAHPTIYWIAGRRDVTLSAYGSSNCPPVPDSLSITSSTRISVHLRNYDTDCILDLGATTSEFELPSSVSRHATVRVTLEAKGMTATTIRLTSSPTLAPH
jgi:hypothetical protein